MSIMVVFKHGLMNTGLLVIEVKHLLFRMAKLKVFNEYVIVAFMSGDVLSLEISITIYRRNLI